MVESKKDRRAKETRECVKAMRRLFIGIKGRLEENQRGEGVTLSQVRLLHEVRSKSDVSAAALARSCFVTPQSMQSLLTRAEREGWIVRSKSQRNGRILTTSLTPAGEAVLQRAENAMAAIEADVWQDVKLSEIRQINEMLKICLKRFNADETLPDKA